MESDYLCLGSTGGVPTPALGVIRGRVRAQGGRLYDDAGPWTWLGVSEFLLPHQARIGNRGEVVRRLDQDRRGGRTIVRVMAYLVNLVDFGPHLDGWQDAISYCVDEAAARGMHTEINILADAQRLDRDARRLLVQQCAAAWGGNLAVVFRLVNESYGNGFADGGLDPELWDLAELLAGLLGHRDFLISDIPDGDNPDASAETIAGLVEMARHSNLPCLHPSRAKGAANDGDRMRRYVDHEEGSSDILAPIHQVNPEAVLVLDEPMGNASQRWVPIPGHSPYEREYVEGCAVAGALSGWFATGAHTYHYIAEQDPGTPGLEVLGRLHAQIPFGPGWRYLNDTWGGAATNGFEGWGKVRTWTDGHTAYVLAEGRARGAITWANGFRPETLETLYDFSRHQDGDDAEVAVWRLTR